jgi:hypothetical protein
MKTGVAQGNCVLFSEMIPDASYETEFNDWYDLEHIRLRMRVPGFRSAQRYVAPGTRRYLAIYEMEAASVLQTPPYQEVKNNPSERTRWMLRTVGGFTRYIGDQIGVQMRPTSSEIELIDATYVYAVFFAVPTERQPEFNDWYERDHAPTLLECEDWLMVRRFRIVDGEPEQWSHLALHYLADIAALSSPERERARASPWRARLAQESWFNGKYVVFAKYGVRQWNSNLGSSTHLSNTR